jgi:outer membrane lipopolysaccharide assembly protein LptE/RlpB
MDTNFNEVNDFVIDGREAEVKAIHDDYNRTNFDQNNRLLTKSLPNSYRIDDLYDEISEQLIRKKWCDHLSKAVCQKGKKMQEMHTTQLMSGCRVRFRGHRQSKHNGYSKRLEKIFCG